MLSMMNFKSTNNIIHNFETSTDQPNKFILNGKLYPKIFICYLQSEKYFIIKNIYTGKQFLKLEDKYIIVNGVNLSTLEGDDKFNVLSNLVFKFGGGIGNSGDTIMNESVKKLTFQEYRRYIESKSYDIQVITTSNKINYVNYLFNDELENNKVITINYNYTNGNLTSFTYSGDYDLMILDETEITKQI